MNLEKAIEARYKKEEPAPVVRTTMTIKEIATYLDLSVDFMYKLCREKKIPHIKIGARILFKKDSIDRWLSELEQESYYEA